MSNQPQFDSAGRKTSIDAVRRQELPESVAPIYEEYDDAIGDRDPYLWRWLANLFPEYRLSCVADEHARRTVAAKHLVSLFLTVVDDVAEKYNDRATFEEAVEIPFDRRRADPNRQGVDGETIRFLRRVWTAFQATIADSPRLAEFEDILRFDLRQVIDAMEYAELAGGRPELVSEEDLWRYDAYNMMVFLHADVDLMNAPAFDATELAALRRLVRRAQRMARISNWLVTWERELLEGDPVSGVVVRALEAGIVSIEQLRAIRESPTPETVRPVVEVIKDSDVDAQLLARWQTEYDAAAAVADDLDSIDGVAYLDAFEWILVYHVESEGLL